MEKCFNLTFIEQGNEMIMILNEYDEDGDMIYIKMIDGEKARKVYDSLNGVEHE